MSFDRALEKAMRYCSYQERCRLDLETRFEAWNVKRNEFEQLIEELAAQNFFNENRYIEAYVRGKFLMKKWGRNKIKMGLLSKQIFNEEYIFKAFNSGIDELAYQNTIKELITKKTAIIEEPDPFKKRDKIYNYMLGKGFESDLVVKELNALGNSD